MILEGQDATNVHVREREVGFVFQHYALFRHMTVFDNIAFGLRVRPRATRPSEAEIKKRVMRLLDLVQLGFLADRYPAQLIGWTTSTYCTRHVLWQLNHVYCYWMNLLVRLDAKVRKELRRWLSTLHDELHITSIFVTHDQEEALEVADQIIVMNKGNVEANWFTT